ncbi:MAG: YqgE/AlgH family protein [Saprospiraceae bacterium]
MEDKVLVQGTVLLAEPFMMDPNFKRTAVLLTEHGQGGSVGFVMNRPMEMSIDELLEDFPKCPSRVFWGGPVQTNTVHYVHNVGPLLDGCVKVADGVYWGGDYKKLKLLIASRLILPENIRFFIGYSGWGEGQLGEEIRVGSWIAAEMDTNYLFRSAPEELWQQIMGNKGDNYGVLAQLPENLSWN